MSRFKVEPKNRDVALRELSQMLFALPSDPTPGVELLESAKLDYSLASLAHLDAYLFAIRQRQLGERDAAVIVMRSGAYLGEVIRRNSTAKAYHWLDYDTAIKLDASIGEGGGRTVTMVAVLWDGAETYRFPLAKTFIVLADGDDESTSTYASAVLAADAGRATFADAD